MLNRALLVLLAVSLPLAFAGAGQLATADVVFATDPLAPWDGIPDTEQDSGRFVAVSGLKNRGIDPDPTNTGTVVDPENDPQKLILTLKFDEVVGGTPIGVQIFDADTKGLWDQRDDRPPVSAADGVLKPYDTTFSLYPDTEDQKVATQLLTTTVANGSTVAGENPIAMITASALATNADWTMLNNTTVPGTGPFYYTLYVTLEKGIGDLDGLSGFEINGFKIATTGKPLITNIALLGFIGGAVDTRTAATGIVTTLDPWANGKGLAYTVGGDNYVNNYTGEWEFDLEIGQVSQDVELQEADADWNQPIELGSYDPLPTGIPTDDAGAYLAMDLQTGQPAVFDNYTFLIPLEGADAAYHGLLWEIKNPGGTVVTASYNASLLLPGHPDHPSITGAQQQAAYPAPVSAGQFQRALIDKDDANANADQTWTWEWRGVDARNLIWIRANQVNQKGSISGRLYCDDNKTTAFDTAPSPADRGIGGVTVDLWDISGVPFKVTDTPTAATTGLYSFDPVDAGTYEVRAPAMVGTKRLESTTPLPVTLTAGENKTGIDFLYCCVGTIVGTVFVDKNGNAVYDAGDDLLPGVQVDITPAPGVGDDFDISVGASPNYKFPTAADKWLENGDYTVTVNLPQAILANYTAVTTLTQTKKVECGQVIVDFGFEEVIEATISGHVIRETRIGNCTETLGETGIAGVTVKLFEVSGVAPVLVGTYTGTDAGTGPSTAEGRGYYEFTKLPLGSYRVEVLEGDNWVKLLKASPCQTIGTTASGGLESAVVISPVSVTAPIEYPDNDFFFYPGGISIRVVKRSNCDPLGVCCENIIQGGDVDVADGHVVTLKGVPDAFSTTPGPHTATTVGGIATFTGLDADIYTATVSSVAGFTPSTSPAPGAVTPDYPLSGTGVITLGPGDLIEKLPSVWCAAPEECDISGVVERATGGCDCTGTWSSRGPLNGVTVKYEEVGNEAINFGEGTTKNLGNFSFTGLDKGSYRVWVPAGSAAQPELLDLTVIGSDETVVDCDAADSDNIVFEYGTASVEVRVKEVDCNGDFVQMLDNVNVTIEPAGGPPPTLMQVTGAASAGTVIWPTAAENGIETGLWDVTIGAVPANLTVVGSSTQPVLLDVCKCEVVEFVCKPECLGKICGRIWLNKPDKDEDCDWIYDYRRKRPNSPKNDEALVGAVVELVWLDTAQPRKVQTRTIKKLNAKGNLRHGKFCFGKLPAGRYRLRIPNGQPLLDQYERLGPRTYTITLPQNGYEWRDFPYCDPCEEDCCIGDLHEVVVETKFWWGYDREDDWLDIQAFFWDACRSYKAEPFTRVVDYAGMWYTGAFPGPETGFNDVMTIETVRIEEGWVIVRLRLIAQGCAFPGGFFGTPCRTIGVSLNGEWNIGKSVFRCECVRPGSWFTWMKCCGFPECMQPFTANELGKMILEGPPGCCPAEYLVLDTKSYDNWLKCEMDPQECKEQSDSCECGYNLVELEQDFWVDKKFRTERHKFTLELLKWGTDSIDDLTLRFRGDEWHGTKKGSGKLVTLTDVWLVEEHEYADLWRARFTLQACDRADGNPGVLPEQIRVTSTLEDWEHSSWLELDNSDTDCLEVGQWLWEGRPIGFGIVRWLSVSDAAWCEPHPCENSSAKWRGYCAVCPEPQCDDEACPCGTTTTDCDCTDCTKVKMPDPEVTADDDVDVPCGCGK